MLSEPAVTPRAEKSRITRGIRRLGEVRAGLQIGLGGLMRGRKLPQLLLYFGQAPGDDLLCSAPFREFRKRDRRDVWMASNFPELFTGNPDVEHVIPVCCARQLYCYVAEPKRDGWSMPSRRRRFQPRSLARIIAELCASAGITGPVTLRPYCSVSSEEAAANGWAADHIVVQSSGLAARFPMLEQAMVSPTASKLSLTRCAHATGPSFRWARPKTRHSATSLIFVERPAFASLPPFFQNARLYVGNVGFLMHLARASECPSVIIYGGREAPWQSGYSCNTNITRTPPARRAGAGIPAKSMSPACETSRQGMSLQPIDLAAWKAARPLCEDYAVIEDLT